MEVSIMCKWGTSIIVEVTMQPITDEELQLYCEEHPEDIRCQGEWKKECKIDSCIADIIQVLEDNDVRMLSSCCGHGKCDGSILLKDKTELVIPIQFTSNKRN